MLKISQSPTFLWPVTVMVPVDGGKHEPASFDVEFVRMPQSQVVALLSEVQEGKVSEVDGLLRIVRGWAGVVDENGEVPFSEDALRMLVDRFSTAGAEILRAFGDARSELARRKN